MKRYYVCDIIGDGSFENPYRAAVADGTVNAAVTMPNSDPNTGAPLGNWCLCMVATGNHARLNGRAGIDAMPDFPLDGKVSAIQTATRNAVSARLSARGIPDVFSNSDGYREVIRKLGQQLQPDFSENNFDILDNNDQ